MINPSFNTYYKCGIMLILKGWCSPCTAVVLLQLYPILALSFPPRVVYAFMHSDMRFSKEICVI